MVSNVCYRSTEPNVGLELNAERATLKCYSSDTGLLISQAFSKKDLVTEQIHRRILFDALEINKGTLVEGGRYLATCIRYVELSPVEAYASHGWKKEG